MITDGEPTDMQPGDSTWNNVTNEVKNGENNGKFLFLAVGVEPANMRILKQIAPPNRAPMELIQGKFAEMFMWLKNSQEAIAASKVGEMTVMENPSGWGKMPTN